MKTYAVIHSTHPCTELVLDVNQVRGYLGAAGLVEVADASSADLVVVSTCAFNQEFERDAVAAIEQIKKTAKAGAKVVVAGCLSKINPDLYAATCDFQALPPSEMGRIEALVPSTVPLERIEAHTVSIDEYEKNDLHMTGIRLKSFFRKLPFVKVPSWLDTVPMPDWFFVRGATGCTGTCSYCAIKRARGNVKSTPPDLVVSQVRAALGQGYKEISLAGDDMGCYGVDLGLDLPYLLSEILKVGQDFVVNIRFVEPKYLIAYLDALLPLFRTGRITSFCAPLQTGSQRLLEAMHRDYEIGEAVAAINQVLRTTKVSSISSNCMVGFPGETAEDFEASYRLLETCDVRLYQVLKYEGRPGTPAEALDGKVPEELKERRRARFVTKMKLLKFACLPNVVAEGWASLRHGALV